MNFDSQWHHLEASFKYQNEKGRICVATKSFSFSLLIIWGSYSYNNPSKTILLQTQLLTHSVEHPPFFINFILFFLSAKQTTVEEKQPKVEVKLKIVDIERKKT